jgi:hypothetical protein
MDLKKFFFELNDEIDFCYPYLVRKLGVSENVFGKRCGKVSLICCCWLLATGCAVQH